MDFFTAGILGLFLSTVGIFHRLGFGDGRPYFYDLSLARVIFDSVNHRSFNGDHTDFKDGIMVIKTTDEEV